ncbi:MAG: hypothetical protein ACT4OT_13690 [Acidobacteriota bacterium]
MRKTKWLFTALILPPLIAASEVVSERLQTKVIYVDSYSERQLLRGKATEIIITARNFEAIQSVEIMPSGGVTAGEAKALDVKPEEQRRGLKRWSVLLTVEASAAPGERKIALVTPQGRTKDETIRIASHLPQISNLKVLSKKPANAEVVFSVDVNDEAGDIGSQTKVSAMLFCAEAGFGTAVTGPAAKIEKKGTQKSVVHGRISEDGSRAIGACDLDVSVVDDAGVKSNKLTAQIKF